MKPYTTGETPEVGDVVRIVDWSAGGDRFCGKDWAVTALDSHGVILGAESSMSWNPMRFALVRRGEPPTIGALGPWVHDPASLGPPVHRPAAAEQAALLDHFAGLAIQGVSLQRLIDPSLAPIPVDALAHHAYSLAAAMLAERARRVARATTETP